MAALILSAYLSKGSTLTPLAASNGPQGLLCLSHHGLCQPRPSVRRSLLVPVLAAARFRGNNRPSSSIGAIDLKNAKAARKTRKRREWTKADLKELKDHSKARTPVVKIAKLTKRSVGALRQKALHMGIGLGHRR
jgi:hypothetical protein